MDMKQAINSAHGQEKDVQQNLHDCLLFGHLYQKRACLCGCGKKVQVCRVCGAADLTGEAARRIHRMLQG